MPKPRCKMTWMDDDEHVRCALEIGHEPERDHLGAAFKRLVSMPVAR